MPRSDAPVAARVAFATDRRELTNDLQPLLRPRLILVCLLSAAAAGFFGVMKTRSAEQWEFFTASAMGIGLMVLEVVVGVTSLTLAALLWRRKNWTVAGLRAVEFAVVGLVAIYAGWTQFFGWSGERFTAIGATHPFLIRQAADSMALRWVVLIVGVATLIPESWRRSAAISTLLATLAFGLSAVMVSIDPFFAPSAGSVLLIMAFWLTLGTTIAIFGAYKLAELRQQVDEARDVGQYRLVKRIGGGGMGDVFLAEHVMLKQQVAIKLIRPERAGDPEVLRRFQREVQATARLTHWNTVRIYDYGNTEDGAFYYAMEYLPGLTLDDMIRCYGPLPPARAVHFLRQVCGALREAHGKHLVHRDIKPANVIACERGCVYDVAKLLDFGLVRSIAIGDGDGTITQDGMLAGTPAYMSPEHITGDSAHDARSDIYSVGALAFYLLTGQPPFVRDRAMQVLMAHVNDPPEPPSAFVAGVPRALDEIVMRCLAKDPADRFQSVIELEEALATCGAGTWTETDAEDWWKSAPARQSPVTVAPGAPKSLQGPRAATAAN